MAGPGDEIASRARGHDHLRVSHADREQVIDALKAAFVRGVLAKDELDLRVGQTFASRTYAELADGQRAEPAGGLRGLIRLDARRLINQRFRRRARYRQLRRCD